MRGSRPAIWLSKRVFHRTPRRKFAFVDARVVQEANRR